MKVIFCEQVFFILLKKQDFFPSDISNDRLLCLDIDTDMVHMAMIQRAASTSDSQLWFWPSWTMLSTFLGFCSLQSNLILSLTRLLEDTHTLAFFSEASRLHLCQSRIKTLQLRHIYQYYFSISDFPRQPQTYLELMLKDSCTRVKIKVRIETSHHTQ